MTVDPKRALDININASLEFLARVTDKEMIRRNWRNFEGFLDIKAEDCFSNWGDAEGNEGQNSGEVTVRGQKVFDKRIFGLGGEDSRKNEVWVHVSPGSKGRVRDDGMETREAAMREGNVKLAIT